MAIPPHSSAPLRAESFDSVPVESLVIRTNARTFAIKVPDDAMLSVGRLRGDVGVFEHRVEPREGDVVAALVDGASVLRVWSVINGRAMLKTADGRGDAVPAEGLVIQGVMVKLVRSRGGRM